MSEKFCLKWNEYQSNWNMSLSDLRKNNDFSDVTLISDDKVKFSAHKILLSSCSSMLKVILKSNPHANSLLFLGGVSSINLGYILDYIYQGEVKLYPEQLESFFESSQKLEIEGLLGDNQVGQEYSNNTFREENMEMQHGGQKHYQPESLEPMNRTVPMNKRRQYTRTPTNVVDKIEVCSMTPEETEEKMTELYQKTDDTWSCLACDYTNIYLSKMKRHIETHIDGLSYTCTLCNKEFR